MAADVADPARPEAMPATILHGVGSKVAERLEQLGLRTVADLVFHLPMRYEDRTRVTPIAGLVPGTRGLVEGCVTDASQHRGGRQSLVCRIEDGSGALTLRFFHFTRGHQARLVPGARVQCFGEARAQASGLEMVHPEYRLQGEDSDPLLQDRLTPVYPTTEGLTQATLRRAVHGALDLARPGLADGLDPASRDRLGLPPLAEALEAVHRPLPGEAPVALLGHEHPARRRIILDELLARHLSLLRLRRRVRRLTAPVIQAPAAAVEGFVGALPFALTGAQRRAITEIAADLASPHPMMRLVQGDVGSGKTVVAAAAMVQVAAAGLQSALMAPTELLAEQHHRALRRWLEPQGLEVALLAGSLDARGRREAVAHIAGGRAAVAAGTHALFQRSVEFARLALVVIDEQHRFGVHQRLALRQKGAAGDRRPHQLVMTATPIPRTLAMSLYADLDTTTIDELPPGRRPVQTVAVPEQRREEVIARIRRACAAGRQAYWVCTLVEDSESLQAQAAVATAQRLRALLPGLRVGLVHGRLSGGEKESVMAAFIGRELDLLVATTVIEVGVDVPNASLMIIENAERLGLAQLHQLRGRVGRGSAESACVLMYRPPLSEQGRARLGILRETTDGFEVARRDLELRGPGEVLGTRQTGTLTLRVADLMRDSALLPALRSIASRLLDERPADAERIIGRWLGEGSRYGEV